MGSKDTKKLTKIVAYLGTSLLLLCLMAEIVSAALSEMHRLREVGQGPPVLRKGPRQTPLPRLHHRLRNLGRIEKGIKILQITDQQVERHEHQIKVRGMILDPDLELVRRGNRIRVHQNPLPVLAKAERLALRSRQRLGRHQLRNLFLIWLNEC